jgi:hypothetical protein
MARLNLYIPDDLKARMDAVGDAINWSEVTRPAIKAALAAHEHEKESTMSTAIERLRASKQQAQANDKIEGHKEGRAWAADYAEYAELKRVSAIDLTLDDSGDAAFKTLWKTLYPELSASEVRESCFGDADAALSDDYVRAFINGAQEFYAEVRSEL